MTKQIHVEVKVRLTLAASDIKDDQQISDAVSELISEMDYKFTSKTDGVEIIDTEIRDHEIT